MIAARGECGFCESFGKCLCGQIKVEVDVLTDVSPLRSGTMPDSADLGDKGIIFIIPFILIITSRDHVDDQAVDGSNHAFDHGCNERAGK